MPHIINPLRIETHTNSSENNHPSPLTIQSAANRRLNVYIVWARNDTSVSTPTLRYGGVNMGRSEPQTIGDGSTRASICQFDIDDGAGEINSATTNAFSLSWSGGTPLIHGSIVEAYNSFLSQTTSYSNTGTDGGTATSLTTGHTSTSSSTVFCVTMLQTSDVTSPAWSMTDSAMATKSTTTIGSGTGRVRVSVAYHVHSGSSRDLSFTSSGGTYRRAQYSIRMRDAGDPSPILPSSLWIARGATAADAWATKETTFRLELGATANDSITFKAQETTRLPDNTQASDAWDSVYYTDGVNSCQFFCHVQNSSKEWINITDDVSAVNIFRKSGDLFNNIRPGEAYFVLNNASGKYNQERVDKEIDIVPTAEIRIFATYLVNTHHLFTGTIESFNVNPDLSQRYFTIKAKDQIKKAQSITVTTSLFSNYQVNSYIGDLISKIGISPSSVDAISNTIPVAWADRRVGLNVIEDIAEAGAYTAYVDGHGVFNFRNRNFELAEGNKLSADEFFSLSYFKDDSMVWNKISVGGERRQVTTDVHTLTYITEPIYIGPGSTKNFFLSYIDYQTRDPVPATGIVTPVTSQDIMLFETQSATGTDFTSTASWWLDEFAESSKCYIYNGSASEAWLTKFQIRGRPARKQPAIKVEKEVASSQAIYGVQEIDIDNKWIQDDDYASDYVDFLKKRYEDAEPKLKMTLRHDSVSNYSDPEDNFDAARIELGDLITVTNSYLGFNTKGFVVKELEHDITVDRGVIHDLTLHLDRPTWDESVIIFKLDDPVLGVLNGSGQLVF